MKERVGMEIRDELIFTLINKLASKLVLKSLLNELVSWLRWTRILSCLTHWVHLRAGVINRLTRLTRMCSLCRLVWHPPTLPFSSKWAQPSVMTLKLWDYIHESCYTKPCPCKPWLNLHKYYTQSYDLEAMRLHTRVLLYQTMSL